MGMDAQSIAIQGLNTVNQQMSILAQNIANASTPGYTTKTLQQTSVYIAGQGAGVQTGSLTRNINTNLQYSLWAQNSTAGGASTTESYLSQLQQLFGTPDSNTSFAGALSTMKTDFINLDSNPSSGVLQTQVVDDAKNVANKFNSLSNNIQTLRSNAQADMASSVGSVNQLLTQIASVNVAASRASSYGGDLAGLQDQRDQLINQLSQYMNISTFANQDGTVTVSTTDGTVLANTAAQTLSFNNSPLTAQSYYPVSANGIMLNGQDITSRITSGSIGGLIQLRDTALPEAQAMLDEAAQKMASRFNAQNVKLFTDGSGNVPANTPTTYAGFSGIIQVNTAIVNSPALLQSGTAGGTFNASDTTNIDNVLNYAFGNNVNGTGTPNTPFNTTALGPGGNLTINMPSSGDILNYSNNIISNLAQQYSQAKSDDSYQTNYQDTLQKKMDDTSGVSIDTELTDMVSLQNAYAANAHVMTTISGMFSTLMNIIHN